MHEGFMCIVPLMGSVKLSGLEQGLQSMDLSSRMNQDAAVWAGCLGGASLLDITWCRSHQCVVSVCSCRGAVSLSHFCE